MRLIFFLACLVFGATVIAEERAASLSRSVYAALQNAQQHIQNKQYGDAARKLDTLKRSELSTYEQQQVWQLVAHLRYQRDDFPGALKALKKLLSMPDLAEKTALSLLLQTAQLSFRLERYKACNQAVAEYLSKEPHPSDHVLLMHAQAYFNRAAYAKSEVPLRRVIARSTKNGRAPAEKVLLLMQAVLHQQKKYQAMLPVVKQLVKHYPSKAHLLRLAGVFSVLGRTRQQLAVMSGLYERGQLTEALQLRNLVNLHLLHKAPRTAAEILEKAIEQGMVKYSVKNQRLLAQAWRSAKHYREATKPLQQVAKRTQDPAVYLELGYLYQELQDWPAAVGVLNLAAKGGDQRHRSRAQLLLGVALFNSRDYQDAQHAFELAAQHEDWADSAGQWIRYIEQVALALN